MRNSLNHSDHLDEWAEKLNQSTDRNRQQPAWINHKEQLEHDANKEWWTEKARKQFEHIETKESTKKELEDIKKDRTATHQTKQEAIIITMRPENANLHIKTYSSADQGRTAARDRVIKDIAVMQSFFWWKKVA